MLIGWFLISAASAEQAAATVASALAGVRVADIMTADPDLTPGGSTVQDFIDAIAIHSRQDAFPVVDFNGRLTGLMVVDQLTRIRPVRQAQLRLDRVALAVPAPYRAAPEDPAAALLTRRPLGDEVVAVVLVNGWVAGIVTVADLRRAMRRNKLTPAGV